VEEHAGGMLVVLKLLDPHFEGLQLVLKRGEGGRDELLVESLQELAVVESGVTHVHHHQHWGGTWDLYFARHLAPPLLHRRFLSGQREQQQNNNNKRRRRKGFVAVKVFFLYAPFKKLGIKKLGRIRNKNT